MQTVNTLSGMSGGVKLENAEGEAEALRLQWDDARMLGFLQDQHRVAVTVHPVFLLDGLFVRLHREIIPRE